MSKTDDDATLYTLGDRGQTVDESANDVRGREVKDKDGESIGKVADLLVDDREQKVRFLLVEHGGLLGSDLRKLGPRVGWVRGRLSILHAGKCSVAGGQTVEIVWTGALWPKELDVTDEYVSRELNEFATELSIMFPQVGAASTTLLPEV